MTFTKRIIQRYDFQVNVIPDEIQGYRHKHPTTSLPMIDSEIARVLAKEHVCAFCGSKGNVTNCGVFQGESEETWSVQVRYEIEIGRVASLFGKGTS